MKNFNITINGNKYFVEILKVEDNIAEVEVNGSIFKVEVDKNLKPTTKTPILVRTPVAPSTDIDKATVKTAPPTAPKGAGVIKSPLPGVIIKVEVKEGDYVKVGQRLLILEAMKMENNIESDKEGYVKSIKVKEGDSVLEGDILVEIGG